MKLIMINTLMVLGSLWSAHAEERVFQAEARHKDKLVYSETHTAIFDKAGNIQLASTDYFDPSGKLVATLKSDFSKSITAPDHEFNDLRYEHRHGIRRQGDKIVLFTQDKGGEEQTKSVDAPNDEESLTVGCQGLAYYFKDHLDKVRARKRIPILFLIPGSLDTYDFELVYKGESGDLVDLDIVIKNWFLKLFAPKLEIVYDKKQHRFVSYKGLSNLYDDNKKQQTVEITYKY